MRQGTVVQAEPLYVDLETLADNLIPLSASTIELEEREGRFPKRRQLSGRRTGYLFSEVKEWARKRPVSDLPPPPNTGAKKDRVSRDSAPSPASPASH